jgi:hypothetical protein
MDSLVGRFFRQKVDTLLLPRMHSSDAHDESNGLALGDNILIQHENKTPVEKPSTKFKPLTRARDYGTERQRPDHRPLCQTGALWIARID